MKFRCSTTWAILWIAAFLIVGIADCKGILCNKVYREYQCRRFPGGVRSDWPYLCTADLLQRSTALSAWNLVRKLDPGGSHIGKHSHIFREYIHTGSTRD